MRTQSYRSLLHEVKRPAEILMIGLLALASVCSLSGQDFSGGGPPTGANLPPKPVAIHDLLSISVYGAPELTRTVRVSEAGAIRLPMLAEPVTVLDLRPEEAETVVANALVAAQLLVDPVVTVNIAEYATRPVNVVGAVRRPLTFEIYEETTLLDALARAEGLTEDAGTDILVTTRGTGGVPLTRRVSVAELLEYANPDANLTLKGGEEVRVPEVGRVFVVGNVVRPGAFPLTNSDGMTLLKALALAEGLAPFAKKEAYIYRPTDSGDKEEIEVALRDIMDRESGDVSLLAGDILYVPDNRAGRVTANVLDKIVGFASGTASGALVLGLGR